MLGCDAARWPTHEDFRPLAGLAAETGRVVNTFQIDMRTDPMSSRGYPTGQPDAPARPDATRVEPLRPERAKILRLRLCLKAHYVNA